MTQGSQGRAPSWCDVALIVLAVFWLISLAGLYMMHDAYVVQGTWYETWELRVIRLEEKTAKEERLDRLVILMETLIEEMREEDDSEE